MAQPDCELRLGTDCQAGSPRGLRHLQRLTIAKARSHAGPALIAGALGRQLVGGFSERCCYSSAACDRHPVGRFSRLVSPPPVGLVRTRPDFEPRPVIVDGASELLRDVFEAGGHAHSAVGVASLPGGSCVKVEMMLVTMRRASCLKVAGFRPTTLNHGSSGPSLECFSGRYAATRMTAMLATVIAFAVTNYALKSAGLC